MIIKVKEKTSDRLAKEAQKANSGDDKASAIAKIANAANLTKAESLALFGGAPNAS